MLEFIFYVIFALCTIYYEYSFIPFRLWKWHNDSEQRTTDILLGVQKQHEKTDFEKTLSFCALASLIYIFGGFIFIRSICIYVYIYCIFINFVSYKIFA